MRTCIGRLATLALFGMALVVGPGCAQDNEQTADIQGVAPSGPSGGPTSYQDFGKPKSEADKRPRADYPGAAR